MNNFADRAPLDVLSSDPPPIQRVPAVMDLNFLPDMGRMTARLRSTARTPCSPAPTAAPSTGRSSPRRSETCKLLAVQPNAYLADVITRIVNGHPQTRLDDLMPWAYPTTQQLPPVP